MSILVGMDLGPVWFMGKITALQTQLFKRLHRQEQAAGRGREGYETIAFVEGAGAVVLGIDDDGVDCDRSVFPLRAPGGVIDSRRNLKRRYWPTRSR